MREAIDEHRPYRILLRSDRSRDGEATRAPRVDSQSMRDWATAAGAARGLLHRFARDAPVPGHRLPVGLRGHLAVLDSPVPAASPLSIRISCARACSGISPTCFRSVSTIRPMGRPLAAGCSKRIPHFRSSSPRQSAITGFSIYCNCESFNRSPADVAFCERFAAAKRESKARFTNWLRSSQGERRS